MTVAVDTFILEVGPYDPVTSAVVTVRAAHPEFTTDPGDTPASEPYHAGMTIEGFGSSVWSQDTRLLGGLQDFKQGTIRIPIARNTSAASETTPELQKLGRYAWTGATATVYKIAAGASYSAKTVYLKGTVVGVSASSSEVALTLAGFDALLAERKVSNAKYWGRKYGLRFQNGSLHYVSAGDKCDVTGSFTIEALIRPRSTGTTSFLLVAGKTDLSTSGFYVAHDRNTEKINFGLVGQWQVTAATALADDTFYWVSCVYDTTANTVTIFLNGVQDAAAVAVVDPSNTAHNFLIGGIANTGNTFEGDIAEVRMWNVARTSDQINRYMYGGVQAADTGLIGWWRFAEGTGTTLNDETATNADGTITGASWIGTYEGESTLGGVGKPWGLGVFRRMEPVLIDAAKLIYQVDVRGFRAAIAVWDGGLALTDDGAVADLHSTGAPAGGHFKHDLTRGLIRLGSSPGYRLAAQNDSANYSGSASRLPDVALNAILKESAGFSSGDVDVDSGDFAGYSSIVDAGLWFRNGTEISCSQAIAQLAASYRAWAGFGFDGVFRAKAVTRTDVANTAAVTLTSDDIRKGSVELLAVLPAVKTVQASFAPYSPAHGPSEIAGGASASDRDDLQREWRQISLQRGVDRLGNAFSNYKEDARVLQVETLILADFGVAAYASGVFDTHDCMNKVVSVEILEPSERPAIGDVVSLTTPEHDFDAGVLCLCVGVTREVPDRGCVAQLLEARTLTS